MVGAGLLGGIGFTMSIFITNLAFADHAAIVNSSKLAVLAASMVAGVLGLVWLRLAARDAPEVKGGRLSRWQHGGKSPTERPHEVGSNFLRFPCKRDRGTTLARQRVKKDRLPARTSRAAQREAISAQVLFGGSFLPCAFSVGN